MKEKGDEIGEEIGDEVDDEVVMRTCNAKLN